MPYVCPTCKKEPEVTCKCPRADSTCACGTQWHTCQVHHKLVLGPSDHCKPMDECTCLPREVYRFGNIQVTHDGRNAVIKNPGHKGEAIVERADLRDVIAALEDICRAESVE